MPKLSAMPFPSFEAFYSAEHPGLIGWLQKNRAPDPEAVAQQAFLQIFKSKAGDPTRWTRAYLFSVARKVLQKGGKKDSRLAFQSFDVESATTEGDGVSLATQVAVAAAPDHGPVIAARLTRVKHELRRMPPRMRVAFAIPTIYGKPNTFAATVLDRSVTRVDHLRMDAQQIIAATYGGGGSKLCSHLLRPTPEIDELETPIRTHPAPQLDEQGRVLVCMAKPGQLDAPPPCHAIVHVVDETGDQPELSVSEPCPVQWLDPGDGRWHAQLTPRFGRRTATGARLIGLWLFEGDWLAGE